MNLFEFANSIERCVGIYYRNYRWYVAFKSEDEDACITEKDLNGDYITPVGHGYTIAEAVNNYSDLISNKTLLFDRFWIQSEEVNVPTLEHIDKI